MCVKSRCGNKEKGDCSPLERGMEIDDQFRLFSWGKRGKGSLTAWEKSAHQIARKKKEEKRDARDPKKRKEKKSGADVCRLGSVSIETKKGKRVRQSKSRAEGPSSI